MTHIDTAEMYGNGTAEELIGEAIAAAEAVEQEDVFLVSTDPEKTMTFLRFNLYAI